MPDRNHKTLNLSLLTKKRLSTITSFYKYVLALFHTRSGTLTKTFTDSPS